MKYIGGKVRIAKHILPIILKGRKPNQCYVEPFVGGANLIDKVTGDRLGADSNANLITALKFIRDSLYLIPNNNKEFTEGDYDIAKSKSEAVTPLECLMLFVCSFSGKFKGGFARGRPREDFVRAAKSNATKQSPLINGVEFRVSSYQDLNIPPNSRIYCDPPYSNATGYKGGVFDSPLFWQWCREKCEQGHDVFVSEYSAPDDFVCVWQKDIISNIANGTDDNKRIEKLFIHQSQLD